MSTLNRSQREEIERLRAELAEMTRQRNLEQADSAKSWNEAGRLRAINAELMRLCEKALTHSARVHPDFADELRAALAKATQSNAI